MFLISKLRSSLISLFDKIRFRHFRPAGVIRLSGEPLLFLSNKSSGQLYAIHEKEGNFSRNLKHKITITKQDGSKLHPRQLFKVRFSGDHKKLAHLTYLTLDKYKKNKLHLAVSSDGHAWKEIATKTDTHYVGDVLTITTHTGITTYLYTDSDTGIDVDIHQDRSLTPIHQNILSTREGHFDEHNIKILGTGNHGGHPMLFYYSTETHNNKTTTMVGAALFSKNNLTHIIWRSEKPLWHSTFTKNSTVPLGVVSHKKTASIYLLRGDSELLEVSVPYPFSVLHTDAKKIPLQKHSENPVIRPNTANEWESVATFNPAALQDGDIVHLLYRAIGVDGVSRLGYAQSLDGRRFNRTITTPAYTQKTITGQGDPNFKYDPIRYPSGGSWGGCEDPRLVCIDDTVYLSFSIFDGWDFIRMAISSIRKQDFIDGKWNWSEAVLISPPGEIHKNWVLFPERINGKFAFLSSPYKKNTEVEIGYADSLEEFSDRYPVKSTFTRNQKVPWNFWEKSIRGAGSPPIKTKYGWLVFYHATDQNEPHKYKVGAMLLDINDPSKILHRSNRPIIEPDEWYENEGKPGVVYVCGAVIKDDTLFIYYGGGDSVVCVAESPLDEFLEALVFQNPPLCIKKFTIN